MAASFQGWTKTVRHRTFLKEWREYRNLTPKAAERIGVEQPTLSRLERGISPYSQDFLKPRGPISANLRTC